MRQPYNSRQLSLHALYWLQLHLFSRMTPNALSSSQSKRSSWLSRSWRRILLRSRMRWSRTIQSCLRLMMGARWRRSCWRRPLTRLVICFNVASVNWELRSLRRHWQTLTISWTSWWEAQKSIWFSVSCASSSSLRQPSRCKTRLLSLSTRLLKLFMMWGSNGMENLLRTLEKSTYWYGNYLW